MKILILGGFLGSGKTSILLELAKYAVGDDSGNGSKVVIIENEIGEVGVDDVVLRAGGLQVENMFAGCLCCSLAGELVPTLRYLEREFSPELVIVEATGVACPKTIVDMLSETMKDTEIRSCALVDAKRWPRIKPAIGYLVENQIEGVDTVLVNKVDLVSEEDADIVVADVHEMNSEPLIYKVSAMMPTDETVWQSVLGV